MKQKSLFIMNILALCFILNFTSFPQEHPNSIYLELLGNGGLYSLNYDRLFTENVGGRIGFMYLPEFEMVLSSINDLLIIPITMNYFVGEEHKLELGAGIILLSISGGEIFGYQSNHGNTAIGGTATIGYRYQSVDGGFLFRIGFTPFFSAKGILPFGGISIGVAF